MEGNFLVLDWTGAGYHGFPSAQAHADSASVEDGPQWLQFELILEAAKRGDFSGVEKLVSIYDDAGWTLGGACVDLMGDIGNREFFNKLSPAVTSILDPTYSVDLGQGLAMWGHLSIVPVLLETLAKIAEFDDARHLVTMLSLLLESEPGELSDADALENIEEYSAKVRRRVDDIAAQLGTANAIVMFGELFSVDKLIDVMRRALVEGAWFNPYWRHKFEATTGVDCSGFYRDERLQPLQALAIIEEFEDRGAAKRFTPGRRYFFGHAIPD